MTIKLRFNEFFNVNYVGIEPEITIEQKQLHKKYGKSYKLNYAKLNFWHRGNTY